MSGNANSGPRPKPRPITALEGRPSHHAEKVQPPTRAGMPECPTDLPVLGRQWWDWATSELDYGGVLASRDKAMLELGARHFCRWRQAEAEVDQFGITYEQFITFDKDGHLVEPDDPKAKTVKATRRENPACKIAAREAAAYERVCSKLGLSPTDWPRLAVPKGERDRSGILDVG